MRMIITGIETRHGAVIPVRIRRGATRLERMIATHGCQMNITRMIRGTRRRITRRWGAACRRRATPPDGELGNLC